MFRKVGIQNSDVGELPKRKHTTIRTRRKFEINKFIFILNLDGVDKFIFILNLDGVDKFIFILNLDGVDKFILKNSTGTTWIGLIWLRIGTNGGGLCENGTEHSGSIKFKEFLDSLKKHQL